MYFVTSSYYKINVLSKVTKQVVKKNQVTIIMNRNILLVDV
jgi:hypothetical protein